VANAEIYTDDDIYDEVEDPNNEGEFISVLNTERQDDYLQQAINLGRLESLALALNPVDR
jgi:hypothetical protein